LFLPFDARQGLSAGKPFLGFPEDFTDLPLKLRFGREDGPVFGHGDAGFVQFQQFYLVPTRLGTEYQADGIIFVRLPLVTIESFQIELHLSLVLWNKLTDFQFHRNKAL
jgi:hypothetical protein